MQHENKTTEIIEAGAKGQGNALRVYHGAIDLLRDDVNLDDYERAERAHNAHDAAKEIATEAIRQRNEKLEAREGYLKRQLFGAPDQGIYTSPEAKAAATRAFTEALTSATLADDSQLEALAGMAKKTGSKTLEKAIFAVAHERGRGDLTQDILNRNEKARGLYEELLQVPDAETRQKTLEKAAHAIPAPRLSEVQASPEARQREFHAEQLRRARGPLVG
jgi:hypothetical protein